MTIEEMRRRKKELGLSNNKLAELSGVPVGTLAKILAGTTEQPRFDTLQALEKALTVKTVTYDSSTRLTPERKLSEAAVSYGKANGATLQDYLNLPEDGPRKELIDGVFYDMGEPSTAHQAIIGYVYKKFLDHVFDRKGNCMPMTSPVAVQLDEDDRTVVEPDVLIVCDRNKFANRRIFGAPDFVLEVLSPSTRRKDMGLKLYKYQNAGVREYWIIDPKSRKLIAYDLANEVIPTIYSFTDKVPVMIWNGECIVDLAEMENYMGFLLEQ